ncbi:MAG: hemolysin III family protein [Bacilli bacterium]
MHRSYLNVKENNLKIFGDDTILLSDCILLDINDASIVFQNVEKYSDLLKDIKNSRIDIYIKIDFVKRKECYKLLDLIKGEYISGFYLQNYSLNDLGSFNLRIREFEKDNKMYFRQLDYIVLIDNVFQANRLKNIFKDPRVKYIVHDEVKNIDNEYLNNKIITYSQTYKKLVINSDQIITDVNQIKEVNEKYNINKEVTNKSLDFVNQFVLLSKEEQNLILNNESLTHHYHILRLSKKLDLIDSYPKIWYTQKGKKEKLLKQEIKIDKFYTVGEEIGNAVSHGIGIILSVVALILLILKGGTTVEIMSYIIFALSGITLYTMSTLYHSFRLGGQTKLLFQKFDHMTIYLLIAGTYTPFALIGIGGEIGLNVFVFLWVGSIFGLLLNLFAFGRFRLLHMFLYVALGWVAIFFMDEIISGLQSTGLTLLILGGVMYTLGIFFYALKLFKFTHMVWHVFTLLGTLMHFLAILLYL